MIAIQLHGLAALDAQLAELGAELGAKTLAAAARKAFLPVLQDARARVPVDTGALRAALRLTTQRPESGATVVVVGLRIARSKKSKKGKKGKKVLPPHARWHFAEFGTTHHAARPFLRPAMERNIQPMLEVLKTEIVKGIARALKRRARAR